MLRSKLGVRHLGRRSVRARVALACAGLFLVTGGALVPATYTLVRHSLPSTAVAVPDKALMRTCTTAQLNGTLVPAQVARCKRAFAVAARFGSASQRAQDLHELLSGSLIGLGAATVVAGLLGWLVGKRVLFPLKRVTGAARRASQEHLDERIHLEGPHDELKELADTFDDMLDRLDRAFVSQRRFVANASHELRTPITSVRTLIDVAMAKPTRTAEQLETLVAGVRKAIGQSEAIIDGLLTLARSDRGLRARELVDLEAAAQDAIDQAGMSARASNIAIDADLLPAPALGDRVLVERLAANLVDNAVRYNLPNGSVRIETGTKDGHAYLSVTNTGPVVPQTKLPSLFEAFTRLDERVNNGQGAGLGLCIVASVVSAHNGVLQADAPPDGGLKVTVRLVGTDRLQPSFLDAG